MPILKTKKLNFNIIYKSVQVGKILENDFKNYQTVKMDLVKNILKNNKLTFYQLPLELMGKTFIWKKKSFKNTLNNVKNKFYMTFDI